MPFLSSHGARLYHRVEGRDDRPLLILSNSLGTDFGMWVRQVGMFSERYRVLLYDSRGHGASDAPAGDYSLAELGSDVLALADAQGAARFAFCGVSLGGLVGQWLAIHAADRVSALVLCNSSRHLPPASAWAARMETVRRQGMTALVDAVMERFFSENYRRKDEPLFHTVRRTFLATPPEGYAGCCAAVRNADFREHAGRIRAPTLVIGGEFDVAAPPQEHAIPLAAAIPGAEYTSLPAGHVSNVEAPDLFTRAVAGFLGRHTA